ncbi:MAG: hypothetical protein D6772_14360 [Bacteroidetes bacterium]|nr:MAG: hypothetical protein D6772_14360 [Bacteroidota bacterium]
MHKKCPRCQAIFKCQAGKIENCACTKVLLTEDTRRYLQQTSYDCLCTTCLMELNELVTLARQLPLPTTRAAFKENLHYYLDAGNWVMTEFYLIQRGYCCGNGCRHCPYGK